jgi:cysteine sulfinate desulfinase/cysteine desulfurase-like protein
MKRTYLIDAGNRISEFHEQGQRFQAFIEETVRQLEQVVKTAQEEISHFNKLRQAVNLTITNESLMQMTRAKAPRSNGATEVEAHSNLEKDLKAAIADQFNDKPL